MRCAALCVAFRSAWVYGSSLCSSPLVGAVGLITEASVDREKGFQHSGGLTCSCLDRFLRSIENAFSLDRRDYRVYNVETVENQRFPTVPTLKTLAAALSRFGFSSLQETYAPFFVGFLSFVRVCCRRSERGRTVRAAQLLEACLVMGAKKQQSVFQTAVKF